MRRADVSPMMPPAVNAIRTIALVLLLGLAWGALAEFRAQGGFGALGSSSSDEYEFTTNEGQYNRSLARNWNEQLAVVRGLDFGSYTTANLGEPRRQGRAFVWARSGSFLLHPPFLNGPQHMPAQLAGLLPQISSGEVDYAILRPGANDWGGGDGIYGEIRKEEISADEVEEFMRERIIYVTSIVSQLQAAGGEVVLLNLYDLGDSPVAENHVGKENYTPVLMVNNACLQNVADAFGIPIVDYFSLYKLSIGSDPVVVGGVSLNLRGANDNDPQNFFADVVHPGTIVQGLLANAIVEALNQAYGTGIGAMSDQEILQHAEDISGQDLIFDDTVTTYYDISELVHYAPGESHPFLVWAVTRGLCGAQADFLGNPDGDEHANLVEFGLGTDPAAADVSDNPALGFEGGFATLTVTKPAYDITGVTYLAWVSTDLENWTTSGLTVLVDDATTFKVRWDDTPVAGGTRAFFKLEVAYSD